MRKTLYGLLVFGMCLVTLGSGALAQSTSETPKILFEKEEIKDQKSLFERASKGITDLEKKPFSSVAELENTKTKVKEKVKTYTTTQRIKVEKHPDGSVKESFVTTSFALIPTNKSNINESVTTEGYNGSGSLYNSGTDPSISVKAYSTIYWDNWYDPNNNLYYDLTKVTGGWEPQDSYIQISNRYINLSAIGWAYGVGRVNQGLQVHASINTFSVTAPSEWYPIHAKDTYRTFGSHQKCTISDSSDTWTFDFYNYK
ncbi:hypothetical protein [Effusibacillus consociatus]|uniref:Uncharacterized protein n=1 Tax=Effusibacillus consociatus TaxID=1117041 RepID=A0ABV9PZW1_9BACL